MNKESGPDIFQPKLSPDVYSENHPATDEKDASCKRMHSSGATPPHPIPLQALEKVFISHFIHFSPQIK